eukprot:Nitzschia sp. Nitz4//scaffold144_size56818//33020//33538//NITZ4_006539-RA/size56818-processed-gene-0.85-mRNA-1//-1//CDS//3329536522//1334//frame0
MGRILHVLSLLCTLLGLAFTNAHQDSEFLRDCRQAGFDPLQLACPTCDLLPASHQEACRSCCLDYKSQQVNLRRYPYAVVVPNLYFEEVMSLVREDWSVLMEKLGPERLRKLEPSEHPQISSAILWFNSPPPPKASRKDLLSIAVDRTDLHGWKRDDIREMLLVLVEGKDNA